MGFNETHQYCVLGGIYNPIFFFSKWKTIDFFQQNFTVLRVIFPLIHYPPATHYLCGRGENVISCKLMRECSMEAEQINVNNIKYLDHRNIKSNFG